MREKTFVTNVLNEEDKKVLGLWILTARNGEKRYWCGRCGSVSAYTHPDDETVTKLALRHRRKRCL